MPIRVIHGANEGRFAVEGLTVGQLARQLRDVFNIPASAEAFVNGTEVQDNHVLRDGDAVEFVRANGTKSGLHDFWSEAEIVAMFGTDALEEIAAMGFEPCRRSVYTSDQITSWQAKRTGTPELSKNGLVVDAGRFTISYRDQEPEVFGKSILFYLLARLAQRPSVFVDFNSLKRDVWKDSETGDATVSRTICRLRAKLNELGIEGITLESQRHCVRLTLR